VKAPPTCGCGKLMEEAKRWAEDSTYYQTPFDVNVGRA
jgi:hypothetical protein